MRSGQSSPRAAASIITITSVSDDETSPTPLEHGAPELGGVDQVAVMRERERAVHRLHVERLGVAEARLAGRRVPGMTDGQRPGQLLDVGLGEGARDEAEALADPYPAAVGRSESRGLLTPVLERE